MKKIQKKILTANQNTNSIDKKISNKNVHNLNKDNASLSKIIANSGWYNINATKPSDVEKSAIPTSNNILVAPYLFTFNDINLDASDLKNLDFSIETKTDANVVTKPLKQWTATKYSIESDGYKVNAPSLVWKGSTPGIVQDNNLSNTTIPYKGVACRITYDSVFNYSTSDNLRQIFWGTVEGHESNSYVMTRFDSVDENSASGYGFHTKKIVNFPGATTYESEFIPLSCNYVSDDVRFSAGGDFWEIIDLVDMINVHETNGWQAYYDSDYYWPIIYDSTLNKLVHLPVEITGNFPTYPQIPSDLNLTINENSQIADDTEIRYHGITSTGQSFFYVKNSNEKYNLRVIGGIVYETNVVVADENTFPTLQENYLLQGLPAQWIYDSTETIATIDIPYYTPLSQDVQIRCVVNYIPYVQYKDFKSK